MGNHTDAVWVAAVKADVLLGRLRSQDLIQRGHDLDWRISEDDVRAARGSLSRERVDALVNGRQVVPTGRSNGPDWDPTVDLLDF
jgi:hypothetical protein